PDRAAFEAFGERPGPVKIARINVRGEAIAKRVGDRERFGVVAHAPDRGYRPVALLRHDQRAVVGAVDERRIEEETSLVFGALRRGPARDEPAAALKRIRDMLDRARAHALMQHRAVGDAGFDAMTKLDPSRLGGERFEELL